MSTRPACEDCRQPADLIIKDHSRGYQSSRAAKQPERPICNQCLAALQAENADDPYGGWQDPNVIARYTPEHTVTEQPSLTDTLTPLVAELAHIAEQKAHLDELEKGIKAQIRAVVPGPDKYQIGDVALTVSTNRRFSEKKALALLPEHLAPLVTTMEPRVDRKKLEVLAPDLFDEAHDAFDDRISLR